MTFRFDLADLRLFLNVVEAGSITAGAKASRLGLAAASARVLAMEDTLGAALLTREARGVQPTASGQVLVLHARTLLQQLERLHGGLAEHGQGMKMQVRLLCNTVALHEVLPDRLAGYLQAHPHVNLLVEEAPGHEAVAAVVDGTAEIAIVREHTDVFELDSFVFHPENLVLVTPPGHPIAQAAQSGPVALALADACDVIGLPVGTALQDIWDHRVTQRGRQLNYRIRVSSFDEQCRLVARGAGVALVPFSTARRQAHALDICIVPLTDRFARFALRLCVRRLADLPVATQGLVHCLLGDAAPPATPAATRQRTRAAKP
jgi:DNA-binding transcriptional LysR family regulator